MEQGESVWDELWNELHHQGDVGEASYASVPQLTRIAEIQGPEWNFYSFVATVEIGRHRILNPPLPDWCRKAYVDAWQKISTLAKRDLESTDDSLIFRSALCAFVLSRGHSKLGAALLELGDAELDEYLDKHLAWTQSYRAADRTHP